MFTFILAAMIGCESADSNGGFSSFGSSVSPGTSGTNDQENGDGEEGTENTDGDSEAPSLSSADAWFTDITGYGEVAEIHVYFTDSVSGVDGGSLSIKSDSGNLSENIDSSNSESLLILEDGEITALVVGVPTTEAITFALQVTDAGGNSSNEVETTATPSSD